MPSSVGFCIPISIEYLKETAVNSRAVVKDFQSQIDKLKLLLLKKYRTICQASNFPNKNRRKLRS